jgi:methionyl-tRNA formyltransferase
VLTQPDRPAGRGLRSSPGAVKQLASARGIEVFQPQTLKDGNALDRIAAARPEILVVAAYGLILPPRALEAPPLGALNIHASLLPRWRGAAPIQRTLLAGDRETGISIMQMDAGLDTGPVFSRHALAIGEDDDAQSLHDKLAALGARAIVLALSDIAAGRASPVPQSEAGASYARKIGKAEAEIDWSLPNADIERQVRALRPVPGARTHLLADPVKIWRAHGVEGSGVPGTVLEASAAGVRIACGKDALMVTELQRAGATRLGAADFLRGFPIPAGTRFGSAR